MPTPLEKNQRCRRCGHKRKHHPDPPVKVIVDRAYRHPGQPPITETVFCTCTAGTGFRQTHKRVQVFDRDRPWAEDYDHVEATEPVPCTCTGFVP